MKNKAFVTASNKADSVAKENQRLHWVIKEWEEQRSSFEKAKVIRLTKELESLQADLESMRGKWGRAALSRDKKMAVNATLTDRLAQLKLENDQFEKTIDTLKGKQPVANGPLKEFKNKSPNLETHQRFRV